jgi:hypothetical protein
MLTFHSKPIASRMCDGLSRREFLRVGALGVGGLTLADLLRLLAIQSAAAATGLLDLVLAVAQLGDVAEGDSSAWEDRRSWSARAPAIAGPLACPMHGGTQRVAVVHFARPAAARELASPAPATGNSTTPTFFAAGPHPWPSLLKCRRMLCAFPAMASWRPRRGRQCRGQSRWTHGGVGRPPGPLNGPRSRHVLKRM